MKKGFLFRAIFFLLFLVFFLLGYSLSSWQEDSQVLQSYEFEMDLNVIESNQTAIKIDTDKIYFGGLPRGGKARRSLDINNSYDFPVEVLLEIEGGDLSKWVSSEKIIYLDSNERKKTYLSVEVPEDGKVGNYRAKINILIYKQ